MIKNNMAYEAAAATGYSGGESNEAEILKHLQSLSEEDLLTGQEAVSDVTTTIVIFLYIPNMSSFRIYSPLKTELLVQ